MSDTRGQTATDTANRLLKWLIIKVNVKVLSRGYKIIKDFWQQ